MGRLRVALPILILLGFGTAAGWRSLSQVGRDARGQGAVATTEGSIRAVGLETRLNPPLHAAARYLTQRCRDDGSFDYLVNMNPAVEVGPEYNMLRHAGAIYALSQYYQRYPEGDVADCVFRAAEYLRRAAFGPVPEQEGLVAVWSKPELVGADQPLQAKLGGAGLALVALLEAEASGIEVASIDELRALGRFILFMQKEDGGFYSKYVPAFGGRYDKWTSLYYPGEAALGLAMLHEHDGQTVWLDAARNALGYLARIREGKVEVAADHWALLATARVLATYDSEQDAEERGRVARHAAQICTSILRARPRFAVTHPAYGALTVDGRTTSTATRLEGLIAAHGLFLDDYRELKGQIASVSEKGIDFMIRAQVWVPSYEGGIPGRVPGAAESHRSGWAIGAGATEIRIDYVQHAMSAMMGFLEMPET